MVNSLDYYSDVRNLTQGLGYGVVGDGIDQSDFERAGGGDFFCRYEKPTTD